MRRYLTSAVMTLAAVVVVLGAALSPLALAAAQKTMSVNWLALSNVGQAYGAASAVFAALALAGVTVSLVYQARTVRQQAVQAVREQHREILDMIIDDPDTYGPAFSSQLASIPKIQLRRHLFNVRYMHYLTFGHATGLIGNSMLRKEAFQELFDTEAGRQFWKSAGSVWLEDSDIQNRRFARIADDEYRRAVAAGPPSIPTNSATVKSEQTTAYQRQQVGRTGVVAAIAVSALLLGWMAGRRRRS